MLVEYNSDGSMNNKYIFANGKRIARINMWDQIHYFVPDHLGGTRQLLSETGSVTFSAKYYPFGALWESSGSLVKYRFTGHEFDTESDLYNAGYRNYDPEIGRWLAVDPLWQKYPSMSSYNYVKNNPLKYIDPDGLKAIIIIDRYKRENGVIWSNGAVVSDVTGESYGFHMMEPDNGNAIMGDRTYEGYLRSSGVSGEEYDPQRIQMKNAQNEGGDDMPGSQFHNGNNPLDPKDSQGCGLYGENTTVIDGTGRVYNSKDALRNIDRVINNDTAASESQVEEIQVIINNNP